MAEDAKVIAAIGDLTRDECESILESSGYPVSDELRNAVLDLYRRDKIGATDILAEYDGGL